MGHWLDDVATNLHRRFDRREGLKLAALAALAAGPLRSLALAPDVAAQGVPAQDCLPQCLDDVRGRHDASIATCQRRRSKADRYLGIFSPGNLYYSFCLMRAVQAYQQRRARCVEPNCGDPERYPPSPPSHQPDYCTRCRQGCPDCYCQECPTLPDRLVCCAVPPCEGGGSPCCPGAC